MNISGTLSRHPPQSQWYILWQLQVFQAKIMLFFSPFYYLSHYKVKYLLHLALFSLFQ